MMGKDLNENFSARRKAQERLSHSHLVFTTCIGAGLGLLRHESFNTVIIDEASQQTEPATLVPLVKGCTKVILVGDHLQLRATVQQHAVLQGFDVSLFERLYSQDSIGVRKVMLESQYRMHREICNFSSQVFYEGKLKTALAHDAQPLAGSSFPWPTLPDSRVEKSRMVYVQCSTPEDIGRKSKSNKGQASICADICKRLIIPPNNQLPTPNVLRTPLSIAVLTPYTAQAELLKATLPSNTSICISSIDGFQGREADIVIFCTVRCNPHYDIGFLKDLRRLNVAMTRAKAGCIVVGDRATLTKGPAEEESTGVWKRLLGCLVPVELVAEGNQ